MRVAILVPRPDFHESWAWAFDIEADALRRGGFDVEARHWTEPGDLSGFDLVTPLVAWGYHADPPAWHALLDRLDAEGLRTLNPVSLLRWNSDKRYLAELSSRGIATIPTRLVDAIDDAQLDTARAEFGLSLVIKPPVSAGADGTFRLGPDDRLPAEVIGRDMLVQPFLNAVTGEGEYSLLLFGGQFSHALVKRPKTGDYRVQPYLGGTEQACEAPEGGIELAKAALAAAPAESVYARVDLIRGDDGQLKLIELELIEPALWLELAPDGGASFAAAMMERARQ
nr:hypothetical protein [uncultured Sphingomonas sp.]